MDVEPVDLNAAFTAFVRSCAPELNRFAYVLTGTREAAADLVQTTLTNLYPKWARVANATSTLAYVRQCLLREFLSSERRKRLHLVSTSAETSSLASSDFSGAIQDRLLLLGPLRSLTARQRSAIVLKYYYDMSDRDGAKTMACPVATYRSYLRRGLSSLREQLISPRSEVISDS